MTEKSNLFNAIVEGDAPTAIDAVKSFIESGESPQDIMGNHLIPAMSEVGQRFETNEFFVPDLLLAGRAMQEAMKILNPLLRDSGVEKVGRVVIGTVQGDMHDIGKNLVASMLEGGGFEVIDLGVDVKPEKFVETVKEKKGTIVALSALLTTTMPQMKKVIEALTESGIRAESRVMIGGAPVTQEFAEQIGADGYSENASAAVALARRLSV
ncbi:MAG: corrinoid protein [Planctomycetaceae bacterium]|jgi:corrinoid protein of di/trimethylamine methyltransferase|nr:corrinoid protein [Planctomycetaceae bacterium]